MPFFLFSLLVLLGSLASAEPPPVVVPASGWKQSLDWSASGETRPLTKGIEFALPEFYSLQQAVAQAGGVLSISLSIEPERFAAIAHHAESRGFAIEETGTAFRIKGFQMPEATREEMIEVCRQLSLLKAERSQLRAERDRLLKEVTVLQTAAR